MMQRITSRQNPLVARFREVARGEAPELLLLDGTHLVSEALAASIRVRQAVVSSDALERSDVVAILDEIARQGIDIVAASAPVMDAISPVRSASQLVAIGERPAHDSERVYGRGQALLVLAADVQDPGNLGAIVRVAEASGAGGVIAAGISANPFGWKALRGSMGSALRLPVAIDPDTAHALAEARRRGYRLVATVPRGGQSHVDADLHGQIVIIVGGEGPGISQHLVNTTDLRVSIPMEPPVESLNAAVAAAVLVYEARRQRKLGAGC
jgi:RNA methyltransferase, TrmH family